MNSPLDRVDQRLLVLRCQTGDRVAFEDLVGRYHARLRRYVRTMLSDVHAADDTVQDVWLDVWRGIGRFGTPLPWKPGSFASPATASIACSAAGALIIATQPIDEIEVVDGTDAELGATSGGW